MWPWILVSIAWVTAISGICIMKKLQPESAIIYAFWAVGWCVAIKVFVKIALSQG